LATIDIFEHRYPGRRAQLKRDILHSALTCFNQYGLEITTIDMIKGHCETSVGNIYHHFGSKEGLIAALFFSALEDQSRLLEEYLAKAKTAREGVAALVCSYVDWVAEQPELTRFQFQARSSVAKGPQGDELVRRNRARNRKVIAWLAEPTRRVSLSSLPAELVPSLIIGPSENYARAWLSGRVNASPQKYREELADAAWRSVAIAKGE
jgi:AcrR family transcriptional regulator